MSEYRFLPKHKLKMTFLYGLFILVYLLLANYVGKYFGSLEFLVWIPFIALLYVSFISILVILYGKYVVNSNGIVKISEFRNRQPMLHEDVSWSDVEEISINKLKLKILSLKLILKKGGSMAITDGTENFNKLADEILEHLKNVKKTYV